MSVEEGTKGSSSGLYTFASCVEVPGKAEGIILTENAAHFLSGSFLIVNAQNMSCPVLYKVKTNAPSKFNVRPILGYIQPSGNATVYIQSALNSTDPRMVISGNDKFLIQAMPVSENCLDRVLLQLEQKKNMIYSDSSSGREIHKQVFFEQYSLLKQLWTENESVHGANMTTEKLVISISTNGNHPNDRSTTATEIITNSVASMDADSTSKIRKPLLSLNGETEMKALISENKALSANAESKNKLIADLKAKLDDLRQKMGQFSLDVADGSSSGAVTSSTKSSMHSPTPSDASGTGTGTGTTGVNQTSNDENSNPKLDSTQTSSTAEFINDIEVFPTKSNGLVVAESVKPESKSKATVDELFAGKLGQDGSNGVVSNHAESDGVDIKAGLDFKLNSCKSKIELQCIATYQKLNGVFPVKIGSITDDNDKGQGIARQVCMSLVMNPKAWYELHICFPVISETSETDEKSDDVGSENRSHYGECFVLLKFLGRNGNSIYHHLSCSPKRGTCANSTGSHGSFKICNSLTYSSPPIIATWNCLNRTGCFFSKQSRQGIINYVNVEVEMVFMRFLEPTSPVSLASYGGGGKNADFDVLRRHSITQKLNRLILMSINGSLESVTSELGKKVVIRCGLDLAGRITVLYSILSAYSPVFELICEEAELTKYGVPTISAPYVTQASMEMFYKYIQCRDDGLWLDNFQVNSELLVFAQSFLIPELAQICTRNFIEMDDRLLTLEQALCVILFGKKYGISLLTDRGVRWMESKKNEVETGCTKRKR